MKHMGREERICRNFFVEWFFCACWPWRNFSREDKDKDSHWLILRVWIENILMDCLSCEFDAWIFCWNFSMEFNWAFEGRRKEFWKEVKIQWPSPTSTPKNKLRLQRNSTVNWKLIACDNTLKCVFKEPVNNLTQQISTQLDPKIK